jgi:potassium efflux system protein
MLLIRSLLLLLCVCLPLHAAEPPSRETVEAALAALPERKLPENEQLRLQQTLEQTLAQLIRQDELRTRLASLEQELVSAPEQISAAQRAYETLQARPHSDPAREQADADIVELELFLEARNQQLTEWQQELTAANILIINAQTRPERAQTDISSNQARMQQLQVAFKEGRLDGQPLDSEHRDLLNAELAALTLGNELNRRALAANDTLLELGSQRRELLTARIERIEQEIFGLQALINRKRLAQSEQTREQATQEARRASPDRLLAQETAHNLKLTDHLLRTTDRLNEVTQANLRTRQRLESLTQSEQVLGEQIEALKGSLLLAQILMEQKRRLPQVAVDGKLADEIADIRLYQFELNQDREQLANPQKLVDTLIADSGDPSDARLRSALLELMSSRAELANRLTRELNVLLGEAVSLQLNQRQLRDLAGRLSSTLEEQLFWIPSHPPLNPDWWKRLPTRLIEQTADLDWQGAVRELVGGLLTRPWVFLPLLLSAVLVAQRNLWRRKLQALHADIGQMERDSQRHTPLAILFSLLQALPGSLMLALAGYALQIDARGQNIHLGATLLAMAGAWLVLYTAYQLLAPGGVAERHFGWSPTQVRFLHRQIRWLGIVLLVLVGVVAFAQDQPGVFDQDVLGVLLLLAGFALLTWLLARLMFRGPQSHRVPPLRKILGALITLLPLLLMAAIFAGYYYTALKLSGRLIDTLYALLLWVLLEALLARGLAVAARRLAWQRAQSRRDAEAQAPEGVDGAPTPVEEPGLAIEQVNQQSLRLIRLGLFAGLLAVLWWVWSDLLTVFSYLDNVTLYEFTHGSGAAASLRPISLLDLLGALLIVGLTLVLARNLPGLLEVLVLSRMSLAQGSAYATTTLLSYLIMGFGIVTTLSTLGVSWDKLQWLVAALSVGIGFGMQEIIANFISGLIILFERPVRIGDLVTIGNVTGSVNRIRIRATHIIDADRKVVVVPNKTFITDQLINWTLSDTVTRLVLKVGVGYGSDLELVRRLLYQAAYENVRVMRDPEPLVLFQVFGESTLDHDLIIHVRELGDRGRATDEINRRIEQLFREHGIEIAFRQVDVFVKNLQGQEAQIGHTAALGAAAAATAQPIPPPAQP